jgi:hypothetical protein
MPVNVEMAYTIGRRDKTKQNDSSGSFAAPSTVFFVHQSCVHRIKEIRCKFMTQLQTSFSPLHYGNIILRATTLLLVFLRETDQATIQVLLGFE